MRARYNDVCVPKHCVSRRIISIPVLLTLLALTIAKTMNSVFNQARVDQNISVLTLSSVPSKNLNPVFALFFLKHGVTCTI